MAITLQNKEDIRYNTQVTLVTVKCCNCGVPFAMPENLNDSLRKTQDSFFCPNGHSQHYAKSQADFLQEELDKAIKDKESSENALRRQIQEEQNNTAIWRQHWQGAVEEKKKVSAELKRTKKRITNGVCPCCNRTFADLAKHMKTKHPDQVK